MVVGLACGGGDDGAGAGPTDPDADPGAAADAPADPIDGNVVKTACGATGKAPGRRMARYLTRSGLLGGDGVDSCAGDDGETEPTLAQGHAALCASAASGQSPPAGPELRRRTSLAPLVGKPLAFDKPLCASVDGFTLHAATRAGGLDARAREALLKYVLRPPIAQCRRSPLIARG